MKKIIRASKPITASDNLADMDTYDRNHAIAKQFSNAVKVFDEYARDITLGIGIRDCAEYVEGLRWAIEKVEVALKTAEEYNVL